MEEDPQLFQQFKGHKDAITASHFSPNSKQVWLRLVFGFVDEKVE